MTEQIKFYDVSACDYSNTGVSTVITDPVATNTGESFAHYMYNRNNTSAWITTGSSDAANTQLDIDFGQGFDISTILLVRNNWKAYTIQYWNGASYVDFSTPISTTTNTLETAEHIFTKVEVQKIRIIIQGTFVADEDKELYQLLCLDGLGQLNSWPKLTKPTSSTNKKKNLMLSGKFNLVEGVGAFGVQLDIAILEDTTDISLLESLYTRRRPTVIWLCGGDEAQFNYAAMGYRKRDLYLVRPIDEYNAQLYKGLYRAGQIIKIKLNEVVN